MANIKSAEKRMRNADKARVRSRAVRSASVTAQRRLLEAVAGGDRAKAQTAYRDYCSMLDKARKTGRIKANTVSRRKSRGARMLAGMAAA